MAVPFLTLIVLTKQKMLQCDQVCNTFFDPFGLQVVKRGHLRVTRKKKVNNDWNVATERILHQFVAWGKRKHI